MRALFIKEAFERKDKGEARKELLFPDTKKFVKENVYNITEEKWKNTPSIVKLWYESNPVNSSGEKATPLENKFSQTLTVDEAMKKFVKTLVDNTNITIIAYYDSHGLWEIYFRIKYNYYVILNIRDAKENNEDIFLLIEDDGNSLKIVSINKNDGLIILLPETNWEMIKGNTLFNIN